MTDPINKKDYSILNMDLEKLDSIISKIVEEYKSGNVKIKWVREEPKVNVYEIEIPTRSEQRRKVEVKNTLLEIVREIQDHFDDFGSRQIGFFDFKRALISARTEFRENVTLLELIICLFDTVKNLRSENLTRQQLNTLENIVTYIGGEVTDADIEKATEELISAGLNPLPSLHGLSEIYREQGEI